jgi:hypothetical protein
MSIQDAQANGLVASLHVNASEKMGLLHGTGIVLQGRLIIDKCVGFFSCVWYEKPRAE